MNIITPVVQELEYGTVLLMFQKLTKKRDFLDLFMFFRADYDYSYIHEYKQTVNPYTYFENIFYTL